MNNRPNKTLTLISMCAFSLLAFPPVTNAYTHWQCFAFNQNHESFIGKGTTLNKAMSNAKSACYHSIRAQGCKTAQSFCKKRFVTVSIQLSCTVSDQKGKVFTANHCKDAMLACKRWQYKHGVTRAGGCIVNHKSL